jgi:hypothetical protein
MVARVLLVTTVCWPSGARIAAAFAKSGAAVAAVFPRTHVLADSRYPGAKFEYKPLAALTSLRASIVAAKPDLLVPLDDRAVRLLVDLARHERASSIAQVIERSLGDITRYPGLVSRKGFIEAARNAGVRAPETLALVSEHDLEEAIAELGLPLVIKSDGSWGGDGVAVAHTREEARAAWRKMSAPASRLRNLARAGLRKDAHFARDAFFRTKAHVSAQAYVAGTPATTAFAAWNGELVAAIHMDVVSPDSGTGPACILSRAACGEMDEAARKLARKFGLSGLHGLDFMRDGAGQAHLIEINPRATQTSHLAFGEGADLPAALLAAHDGSPAFTRRAIENASVALFPQAWLADPASPQLQSAHHDVPWDDLGVLRRCIAMGAIPAAKGEKTAITPRSSEARSQLLTIP